MTEQQFPSPTFTFVKRELKTRSTHEQSRLKTNGKIENSAKNAFLASNIRDIAKTFIIASIIFTIEAMLYFAWK